MDKFDKKNIPITENIVLSWKNIVNTMAEFLEVPAALIMKADFPFIEVFSSSENNDNPYHPGDREHLSGLYCEEVIRRQSKLLIPNALKDEDWAKNPDIKLGMISYLGYPLNWPDGEVFGTICILDREENRFGKRYERLMLEFKELAETHLSSIYRYVLDKKNLEKILDSLHEGIIVHDRDRHIQFFNHSAEKITGFSREEILGNDCHQAFGGPFCGGRCSFHDGPPASFSPLYYPLNIFNRRGEPRRIEMSVSEMQDENGDFEGVIASFRDVTDLLGLQIQAGELKSFAGIIGQDSKMLQIYKQITDLGSNDYPVCITGETGTGKELVATAVHNESRRGGGAFVPVNCAALPEGILESELFGHVKGAFTGAVRDKKGRFELADKGTLFLDEVAELPIVVQAKLLRVIQEGKFERLGDEKTLSVDVRLICATNRILKKEMEKGRFREDLYYRINVVPIHLPPLREKKNDIPLLLDHFLTKAREEGQETPGISKEAIELIKNYPWPGNVRELQSALRFALIKSKGRFIHVADLPLELRMWQELRPTRGPAKKLNPEAVKAALLQSGGNKVKAARILGVGRATLYRFLSDQNSVS
jgi:PAS domain S-box-containing protein